MTEQEAKSLKVGDRVEWSGENNPRGTVRKVAYKYIEIEWDDSSTLSCLHPLELATGNWWRTL